MFSASTRLRWLRLRFKAMRRRGHERRSLFLDADLGSSPIAVSIYGYGNFPQVSGAAAGAAKPVRRRRLGMNLYDGGLVDECRGFKAAYLVRRGEGIGFAGIAHGSYSADDRARCLADSDHDAPYPKCLCGFHTYSHRGDAESVLSEHPGSVLLEVDLYGNIVEHERGVRAEQQVVLSAALPPRCFRCGVAATELTDFAGTPAGKGVPWSSLVVACGRHRAQQTLTLAELSALTAVELRWLW